MTVTQYPSATVFSVLTFCSFKKLLLVFNIVLLLIQKIHDAMNKPGVSAKLKEVLSKVSAYDNVPRKKAKFQVGKISFSSDHLCYFFTLGSNNDFFFCLSFENFRTG